MYIQQPAIYLYYTRQFQHNTIQKQIQIHDRFSLLLRSTPPWSRKLHYLGLQHMIRLSMGQHQQYSTLLRFLDRLDPNALSQGYINLQSLVKCLDHRSVASHCYACKPEQIMQCALEQRQRHTDSAWCACNHDFHLSNT